MLNILYPKVTPRASVALTNYSLKNSPNINRTILGSGLDVDFTVNNETNLFGYKVNHQISPLIPITTEQKKFKEIFLYLIVLINMMTLLVSLILHLVKDILALIE